MQIRIAETEKDIVASYPVMAELRGHLTKADFVAQVLRQQLHGYQIVKAEFDREVVAVAGYRIGENLAWGRFLYVDDLVTAEEHRGKGYGKQLLSWLREHARLNACHQLHLDSGLQREDAHRFYDREGLDRASFHFAEKLS